MISSILNIGKASANHVNLYIEFNEKAPTGEAKCEIVGKVKMSTTLMRKRIKPLRELDEWPL